MRSGTVQKENREYCQKLKYNLLTDPHFTNGQAAVKLEGGGQRICVLHIEEKTIHCREKLLAALNLVWAKWSVI